MLALLLAALAIPAHAACDGDRWDTLEAAFVHGRVVDAARIVHTAGGRRCLKRVQADVLARGLVPVPDGDPRRPQDMVVVLHGHIARAARLEKDCGEPWVIAALAEKLGTDDTDGAVEILRTAGHRDVGAHACTELAVFTLLDAEGWYAPARAHAQRRVELGERRVAVLQAAFAGR